MKKYNFLFDNIKEINKLHYNIGVLFVSFVNFGMKNKLYYEI